MGTADFPAGFFDRLDVEGGRPARLDEAAIAAVGDLYSDLDVDARVLDLWGSSAEYFDVPPDELVAFDGDLDTALPFADATFDDVICSGGVGAMTRPLDTFAEVARVLVAGGRFVCTFSDRLRTRSTIRGWASTDATGRVRIVRRYFSLTATFGAAESDLRSSLTGSGDQVWAVWAERLGG